MGMSSGLVWVARFFGSGRFTFTVGTITGTVIRKMISITSITSTSGVVLISDITWSPPPSFPTLMLMALPLLALVPGRLLLDRRGRRRTCAAYFRLHAADE